MKSTALSIILIGSTCLGFVAWRVHSIQERQTPHFEILEDGSLSHGVGCESLLGLANQALSMDSASSSSTLTVLIIGDERTANEPWLLGRYTIPRTRKVLEGRSANLKRTQGVLREILQKCQTVRPTHVSPVFLGVAQSVADLRARGCTKISQCELFVDSDLEENVEHSIKKSILGDVGGIRRDSPAPIDNEGIGIAFCGLAVTASRTAHLPEREAQTISPRNSGHDDRLRQTWVALFTNPQTVRFEPYCPQGTK